MRAAGSVTEVKVTGRGGVPEGAALREVAHFFCDDGKSLALFACAGSRTDPLMAANTRLLDDSHIEALVAYVTSLK